MSDDSAMPLVARIILSPLYLFLKCSETYATISEKLKRKKEGQ